jgi:hypothetical protein
VVAVAADRLGKITLKGDDVVSAEPIPKLAFIRKRNIARRIVLWRRGRLLGLWQHYFPKHDFGTGRLIRPSTENFERVCDEAEKGVSSRLTNPAIARARRLVEDNISLDRVWNELNDPRNRPTPRATIEAVQQSIRDRGLSALDEPANKARLKIFDHAARAELQSWIEKRRRGPGART